MPERKLYVALVHHPLKNRNGDEITAQTNEFDIMDASRLVHVYDVRRFYVIQPIEAQASIVDRMIEYQMDPTREAQRGRFHKTFRLDSLDEALADAVEDAGGPVRTIATTARQFPDSQPYADVRQRIDAGEPLLLMFGMAWGLVDRIIDEADLRLEPVSGGCGFDHLPVRSAFAIVLDRLLGVR